MTSTGINSSPTSMKGHMNVIDDSILSKFTVGRLKVGTFNLPTFNLQLLSSPLRAQCGKAHYRAHQVFVGGECHCVHSGVFESRSQRFLSLVCLILKAPPEIAVVGVNI